MDELYRRGLRCAQRMPARGPIAQPGIDTRSYAIINVSFASGIDRPLYWQFIHRSPFSTHPNHSPILVGSIQCERLCLKCFPMFFSIYIYIFWKLCFVSLKGKSSLSITWYQLDIPSKKRRKEKQFVETRCKTRHAALLKNTLSFVVQDRNMACMVHNRNGYRYFIYPVN